MTGSSGEIRGGARLLAPPYSDGCPRCVFDGAVAPYATTREGGCIVAFYRHRRCGFQWSCRWNADWYGQRRVPS